MVDGSFPSCFLSCVLTLTLPPLLLPVLSKFASSRASVQRLTSSSIAVGAPSALHCLPRHRSSLLLSSRVSASTIAVAVNKRQVSNQICRCRAARTLCSCRSRFRFFTFSNLVSLFPPPPAVSSTLILRPSMSVWCSFKPCCSAFLCENSTNAKPFDFAVGLGLFGFGFGVINRTLGGGSAGTPLKSSQGGVGAVPTAF